MTTKINTALLRAEYNPRVNSIRFFEGDRPVFGFEGNIAHQKFLECTTKNIPVTMTNFDTKKEAEHKALIRQFNACIAAKGLINIKADIVGSYGVDSSKKMTTEQLREAISSLNNSAPPEDVRKERSILLTLLAKLGINSMDGWDRINGFLIDPRIAGKVLYEMNVKELQSCQGRLRSILNKNKNGN